MALSLRYFNPESTGADTGLSEADAFQTLASLDAGTAGGGFHVYWRRTTADRWPAAEALNVLASGGNSQAPLVHEGYGVTPGDGVRFRFRGRLEFSAPHIHFNGLDLLSTTSFQAAFRYSSHQCFLGNSIVEHTGNSSTGLFLPGTGTMVSNVVVRMSGATPTVGISVGAASLLDGVVVDLTSVTSGVGVKLGGSFANQNMMRNVLVVGPSPNAPGVILVDSLYNATTSDDLSLVLNCSLANGEIGIRVVDLPGSIGRFAVINSVIAGVEHGFSNTNGVNGSSLAAIGNAIQSSVSAWEGVANMPLAREEVLSVDPFADAANLDLTLNVVPGGGASCVALGVPFDPQFDGTNANSLEAGAVQDDAR